MKKSTKIQGPVRTVAQVTKDTEASIAKAGKAITAAKNALKEVDSNIAQAVRTRDKLKEQLTPDEG